MSRIETATGALGVIDQGSGGVPLVFLHGVGSDKSAWKPQLVSFGAQRRTLAFDYPGYGESDPLDPGPGATHDRFAAAILSGLDALHLNKVHLCGLSLGGVVAIAAAHRHPERFASLTLADSFAVHPDGHAILERSLAGCADMGRMAKARVPALFGAVASAALRDEVEQGMARIDPAAFRNGAEAVWPADQRGRATALQQPTLVLCGADDRVTPPALSAELAGMIRRARLVILPQAGHLANLEQPDAFDAALEAFLRKVEPSNVSPAQRENATFSDPNGTIEVNANATCEHSQS